MSYLNRVILTGKVEYNPVRKKTTSGRVYTYLQLLIERTIERDYGGDLLDVTHFDLLAWDEEAELICKEVEKGMVVMAEGRLNYRSMVQRKTGKKRSIVEVIVEKHYIFARPSPKEMTSEDKEFLNQLPERFRLPSSISEKKEETSFTDEDIPF